MDGLTVFTYIASHTTTIKFGTAVYILPLRDPVSTAKTVADLDYLTRGRVLFGVGAGWLEEEFDMVGLDFHTRGARMDECIGVLRALWTEEEPEFHGEHYDLGPAAFAPKPFQKPHPPILVGAKRRRPLRRRRPPRRRLVRPSPHAPERARAHREADGAARAVRTLGPALRRDRGRLRFHYARRGGGAGGGRA